MSDRMLAIFMANTAVAEAGPGGETGSADEPKLLWKVVLRTGTWKLRPGPGGVKLNAPLKILRDEAPKGHISMAELVKSFEAGAKEYVTVPQVHADGTTSDGGFVKKLVIQDVPSEDGSKAKQSLLWAGMEITDSDLKKKLDERSIRGVSGGVLFDYQRTEDAKKFPQILSHVMVTNSPWINGTGDFTNKLPEGVMASEPDDLPIGEVELEATSTEDYVADPTKTEQPSAGSVVWRPEDGFQYTRGRVQKALDDWRRALMASMPQGVVSYDDLPYMHVDDVTNDGTTRRALICSGYGDGKDSWVATFSVDDQGEVVVEPFQNWTPAKQEWVAASEEPPPAAPSAGRASPPSAPSLLRRQVKESDLRRAQRSRAEHLLAQDSHSTPRTPITGGTTMPRLHDLLASAGVELSDEVRQAIAAEDAQREQERERYSAIDKRLKEGAVSAFLAELDKVDPEKKLLTPGFHKVVRDIMLSDDGGQALNFSETTESGAQTTPVAMTATDVVRKLVDALPRTAEGRLAFSTQATNLPGDQRPPESDPNAGGSGGEDKRTPKEKADAMLAEMSGAGIHLAVSTPNGNGG